LETLLKAQRTYPQLTKKRWKLVLKLIKKPAKQGEEKENINEKCD